MLHFYTVKIKDIRKETADCISIAFHIPPELQEAFAYQAGQYLTLRIHINGEEIRRTYSLCSSPLEHEWRIAVKKIEGGIFSTYAFEQLKPGDSIDLLPPMGKFFTPLHPHQKKHYLAFAAGSGITPILSLIKTTLATEPYSNYTLIYGNKTRHSILFKNEIEALKDKYMHRFHVLFVFSKEITDAAIQQGRIDEEKCEQIFTRMIPVPADEYFICGPEGMMTCIHNFLLSKNIPDALIHFELFTAPGQIHTTTTASNLLSEETEKQCEINLKIDGAWHQIYANTNVSVLEAILQQGYDLPYSCKGGVCATCKAQLLEGKVTLKQNYALEPDEIKQGYILSCQAYPLTKKLRVNFDIK